MVNAYSKDCMICRKYWFFWNLKACPAFSYRQLYVTEYFLTIPKVVHLTNVAIQKTAPDYDPEKGCKWSTQQLRKYLTAKHGQPAVSESITESSQYHNNITMSGTIGLEPLATVYGLYKLSSWVGVKYFISSGFGEKSSMFVISVVPVSLVFKLSCLSLHHRSLFYRKEK